MNIINAGNPSANNMLTRQVMQKKRESSATILDKLNKRTAQLTAQNPLNNILTNDQLFRYYIKEVEPKLFQSNDNFQGLPNTTPQTPPDNSIKDTVEKSYGNVKDEYNAGFSGNGVEGILNSNNITGNIDPNQFNPEEWLKIWNGLNLLEQGDVLQDLYDNDKKNFDLLIAYQITSSGEDVNDKNRIKVIHSMITSGMIHDKYENVEETRFGNAIERYEEIGKFLGSLDTNDYHRESAIMLNVFIDTYSGDRGLDIGKFCFNLWNEWFGQTTLDRSITDIWDIWKKSKGTPLEEVITTSFNRIFESTDIETFEFGEFRDLFWNYINKHTYYASMAVKKYKTELAKYQLDKMTPAGAVQNKIDDYKEELRQSRENHAGRLRYYRDLEGDNDEQENDEQDNPEILAGQYQEDIRGNLHLVGQLKDPSTHPSKPQELKNPATYPSAPVSAQSVKNDAVISRRLPKNVSLPKFDM